MTRLFLSAALLMLGAGCAANNNQPPQSQDNSANPPATQPAASAAALPVNHYCAVDRDSKIDPKVTYMYQGKVIGFCCEDCIAKFKKDPAKYAKDLK